ncbi:MAG TPA: prolipoprotein diacylglyceryl transferase [Ilumatobacteraceae bacterium]|nr:prolipoprotein diacylglyceryl transferase [Ilumatobacteraceae bacterium]
MFGLVASIPSPSSGAITLGPLSIHAYGLMIALGVIAAVWLLGRRLEASGAGTREDASSVAVWAVIAGVIGSRLYHVVTDWDLFKDDLGRIPQIWRGGLGIPGGILFGTLAALWAFKRRGIPPAVGLSAGAPALALAQAIGRWGNWFNQELFGKPTDLPWGLRIDAEHIPAGYAPGTTFHPTFLYESLWNFALCIVLLRIDKKYTLRPGRLFAMYLVGYATGRFWVEGLRIDPAHLAGGLRLNQWVALVVGLGALLYLIIDWQRHRNDVPGVPVGPDQLDDDLDDAEDHGDGPFDDLADEPDDDLADEPRVDDSAEDPDERPPSVEPAPEADEPDLRESLD